MPTDFAIPTLTELRDRNKADITSSMGISTTLLRRSVLNILAKMHAGACHGIYGFLEKEIARQLFVLHADSAGLDEIGAEWRLSRTAAIAATGQATATGTAGTLVPAGTQLVRLADGATYSTTAAATFATTTVTLNFEADEGGDDYNDDGGISLSFVSPITGVNTSVVVAAAGITGGVDEEDDDDFRERLLDRKRQPPHGGALFDYASWAKDCPDLDVTRAWSHYQYYGLGTVGVSFVLDNQTSTILPTTTQCTTVLNYIYSHVDAVSGLTVGAPVGARHGIFVFAPTPVSVSPQLNLYPNTTAVQTAIENALTDFLYREGGPGETIAVSRLSEAISLADGEFKHTLVSPASDIDIGSTSVAILGTVTYGAY